MAAGSPPRLAVIMVNWRGAADTIECLESLIRTGYPLHAIVCDNDSGDGSVEAILAWAAGEAQPGYKSPDFAAPPVPKPVAIEHLKAGAIRPGGPRCPVTVIETGGNLGYAGGNNAGIRFALEGAGIDIVWLLNNDTVVEPQTPAAIVAAFDSDPDIGMLGSPLRYYHDPAHHQMLNGMRFNRWTSVATGIAAGSPVGAPEDPRAIARDTYFVCGASLAVTRKFLDAVGLMEDRFFLYYEEIDWALRSRGRFAIGYAPEAVVYHKEGASAGSSGAKGGRSALSDYHHARSKLIFGRKHFPALLPLYFTQNLMTAGRRLLRRQPAKAAAVVRASLGLPFRRPASGR